MGNLTQRTLPGLENAEDEKGKLWLKAKKRNEIRSKKQKAPLPASLLGGFAVRY
jgi:hypothetical protein